MYVHSDSNLKLWNIKPTEDTFWEEQNKNKKHNKYAFVEKDVVCTIIHQRALSLHVPIEAFAFHLVLNCPFNRKREEKYRSKG